VLPKPRTELQRHFARLAVPQMRYGAPNRWGKSRKPPLPYLGEGRGDDGVVVGGISKCFGGGAVAPEQMDAPTGGFQCFDTPVEVGAWEQMRGECGRDPSETFIDCLEYGLREICGLVKVAPE